MVFSILGENHYVWLQDTWTPGLRVKIAFYSQHYRKYSGTKWIWPE